MNEVERFFGPGHYRALGPAVDLAEEVVADHYRVSESFWLDKGRWELLTLAQLMREEITNEALAQIVKCVGPAATGHRPRIFYRICLQDHRIQLSSLEAGLDLQTLLCYVVCHELIHVVRFARYDQLYEASPGARMAEERLVHDLSRRILEPLELPGAGAVFELLDPERAGILETLGPTRQVPVAAVN